ncbi:MAG: tRNA uridine-5-carboxymethylaminomethyl(34) synthesis GTPase MnmE, partial [Chitinophagaceae bacterium]|nr:tRNA uridine-5-carboxymethylaminomethyl(34) synthesis GTPase MnmE [Chitinophagaceae bacterium]
MQSWQDTIVALATPPGIGALGIIRLSGPQAIEVAAQMMPGAGLQRCPSHTVKVGWVAWAAERIDEAVATIYRAPRSFTGEDVVEFSCHGSPYILQQVINAAVAAGARLAKPGEFTQRAFLNGKMDLAQAEAVADVIASHSAAAHHTAIHQMRGGFSHVLAALREQLIKFSALIELELDFATEDVEFADRTALLQLIASMDQTVQGLLQSFQLGNVIKQGVAVAIVGKPNAGKSTLLNTLLNENRAIVSDIAGTTRDTIEEMLNISGVLFRLIDTAGIRQSTDQIEAIGVEKSLEKMRQADIVL